MVEGNPRKIIIGTAAAGGLLFASGLTGGYGEAWGWGLLLVSALLLTGGTVAAGLLFLSKKLDTDSLKGAGAWLLIGGAVFYALGVCALGGFYVAEALESRMEWRWMVFGPVVLAAIIALDVGLYRVIVARNLPTYRRYGAVITRAGGEPAAMRRTLIDDVVLHKALFSVSRFRWLKHTLIFWGFGLLFATECLAVLFRDMLPAFGRPEWWMPDHPLRLAFDFAFDAFGLMSLLGCLLALGWRVVVHGTFEQKFTDTPTAAFLLFVLASGFMVEGLRLAAAPVDPFSVLSFVGYGLATLIRPMEGALAGLDDPLWYGHVIASCLFIAYVPAKRLVHSCATPLGRLMTSQKGLLEAKRRRVIAGLFGERP